MKRIFFDNTSKEKIIQLVSSRRIYRKVWDGVWERIYINHRRPIAYRLLKYNGPTLILGKLRL